MRWGWSGIFASLVNALGISVILLTGFYLVTWWWLQVRIFYDAGMVSFAYETGSSRGLGDPTLYSRIIMMDIGGVVFSNVVLLMVLTLPIWGALHLSRTREESSADDSSLRA